MVLAIAAGMNWEVVQLGATIFFLYADIERDFFRNMTSGFEIINKEDVQLFMKPEKSLGPLAQSPRNWWKT